MMKKAKLILYFLFLLASITTVNAQKKIDKSFDKMLGKLLSHSIEEINPNEVSKEDCIFLDAREKEEFEVSHLPNAIFVGYNEFDLNKWQDLDKEKEIIIYCSVGYRSEKIAEQFQKNGFKNIKNLYGGIFEWVHQNKSVVKNNHPTDSIHTYNKEWSKWLLTGTKVY